MIENNQRTYQVYFSETSGKYFVRYSDQSEKEITKTEYLQLLEEKQRALQHIANNKTTFEQTPQRILLHREIAFQMNETKLGLLVYAHPSKEKHYQFEFYEELFGEAELHPQTMNIYKLSNHSKEQNMISSAILVFYRYAKTLGIKGLVIENSAPEKLQKIKKDLSNEMSFLFIHKNSMLIWEKEEQLV